jgi:hypothetical protein
VGFSGDPELTSTWRNSRALITYAQLEFALLTGPSGSFSGPGLKKISVLDIPIYVCVCVLFPFFLLCPSLSWAETKGPGAAPI